MEQEYPHNAFGQPRPKPHFPTADRNEDNSNISMQPDAAASRDDTPIDAYVLSVEEIRSRLFDVGLPKSKDTIQRYCREGTLNCLKLGMLRRYFATEDSVCALIENLQQDADVYNGMQVHEGSEQYPLQLHAPKSYESQPNSDELHEAASTRLQPDTGVSNSDLEGFYREQIRIKDDQIRVKDEQIAAMLERDRETNILVRELQGLVAKTFSMLPSGKQWESEPHHSQPDVENGEAGGDLR